MPKMPSGNVLSILLTPNRMLRRCASFLKAEVQAEPDMGCPEL